MDKLTYNPYTYPIPNIRLRYIPRTLGYYLGLSIIKIKTIINNPHRITQGIKE